MASAPQQQLPIFYKELEPLSSQKHGNYRARQTDRIPFMVGQNAIPLTVDEFASAQRFMPIVFSTGPESLPLALMGLNEGVNVFFDEEGRPLQDDLYLPAYARRYPYLLARLRPDSDELSLCFDPSFDGIGPYEDGIPLFDNGEPSEMTKSVLEFNKMFEEAGARTAHFMQEIAELDLLMDGEVSIQRNADDGQQAPYIYRGFQMINQEKLADLRGDQLRKINQSGLLALIHAHLFSLSLMRDIFERQVRLGVLPPPQLVG